MLLIIILCLSFVIITTDEPLAYELQNNIVGEQRGESDINELIDDLFRYEKTILIEADDNTFVDQRIELTDREIAQASAFSVDMDSLEGVRKMEFGVYDTFLLPYQIIEQEERNLFGKTVPMSVFPEQEEEKRWPFDAYEKDGNILLFVNNYEDELSHRTIKTDIKNCDGAYIAEHYVHFGYWGNDKGIANRLITYHLKKSDVSQYGCIVESISVRILPAGPKLQQEEKLQYSNERVSPFFGIWCMASRDRFKAESDAEQMRNAGYNAYVFLTTEWSDLNKEPWYVVSAGIYDTESEANNNLSYVREYYGDAYVKFSGDYRGYISQEEAGMGFSPTELAVMAQDYCEATTGFRPPLSDAVLHDDGSVTIHLYEIMDRGTQYERTGTANWYTVDAATGKGTDITGNYVDLAPYARK